jgi:hypothetical protein
MAILTCSLKFSALTRFSRSSTEAIRFTGISIRMITRVLAQVIESLCILHDSAGSLGQSQEFIELSLNESFWNVMHSETVRNSSHVTT